MNFSFISQIKIIKILLTFVSFLSTSIISQNMTFYPESPRTPYKNINFENEIFYDAYYFGNTDILDNVHGFKIKSYKEPVNLIYLILDRSSNQHNNK